MAGKKYICTKAWARNKKDDVIMDWELKKYPVEIQKFHFEELVEKKKTIKPNVSTTFQKEVKPLVLDSHKNKGNESIIAG